MRVGDPPVGGRYSLVEPFGADERFAGGQVQTWRARDTLVERDVILRVITPGGNSARLFLDRALEMSLIAHPGLGMVYEAVDHGDYAVVVCEWIDGTSLADTLQTYGPLTPPTARQTLGDVAEAITVAHHAGLPIGGITAERVVLRDNASVAVTAVPALFADERGDIQQLGELLYAALTGEQPDLDDPDLTRHLHRGVPRDLAVLCQRALDTDPSRQLGSAAAFAAVLRPRTQPQSPPRVRAGRAGRAGERLGGLDPDPKPHTHDTAPALVGPASEEKRQGPSTTAERALPLPLPTVASDAGPAVADGRVDVGNRLSAAAPTGAEPVIDADADTDVRGQPVTDLDDPGTYGGTGGSGAEIRITDPIPLGNAATAAGSGSTVRVTGVTVPVPVEERRRDLGAVPAGQSDRYPPVQLTSYPAEDAAGDAAEDYDPWLDTGSWGNYDDGEDDPEKGTGEASRTRRKVLLYAVPLIALLLVVVLGVVVGRQFSAVVTDDEGAVVPSSQSSASASTPAEGEAPAETGAPVVLPPVSAAVFDPFGDGQPENDEDVGLSYDGDVGSAWQTLTYQNTPEFGNLKPGVGVIFDLGAEHEVQSVELATNLPGTAVEIRVGAAPDAALDSYPVVGTLDPFSDSGSVVLAEPVRTRFVIVWFVRLVEDNGGFRGALAECRILGV